MSKIFTTSGSPCGIFYKARATWRNGKFVVLKGSTASASHTHSLPHIYLLERERLLGEGVLCLQGNHLVFTKDCAFSAPSRAACVVAGSSRSHVDWKNSAGETPKQVNPQSKIKRAIRDLELALETLRAAV